MGHPQGHLVCLLIQSHSFRRGRSGGTLQLASWLLGSAQPPARARSHRPGGWPNRMTRARRKRRDLEGGEDSRTNILFAPGVSPSEVEGVDGSVSLGERFCLVRTSGGNTGGDDGGEADEGGDGLEVTRVEVVR